MTDREHFRNMSRAERVCFVLSHVFAGLGFVLAAALFVGNMFHVGW